MAKKKKTKDDLNKTIAKLVVKYVATDKDLQEFIKRFEEYHRASILYL